MADPAGPQPYYSDGACSLYVGDCREILPALGVTADCIIADPPYGETSHEWDRWPDGWLETAAAASRSMWCFGSLRLFMGRAAEIADAGWKLSQDIVMEKSAGAGVANDRFRRVHETITHWYRGRWSDICHNTPRVPHDGPDAGSKANRSITHLTGGAGKPGTWTDDGTRYARTVLRTKANRGRKNIHPSQKPEHILSLLITYACPPGGLVIDPFAGSGSTLRAARASGRRAIGIESRESQAEAAVRWLSQVTLEEAS